MGLAQNPPATVEVPPPPYQLHFGIFGTRLRDPALNKAPHVSGHAGGFLPTDPPGSGAGGEGGKKGLVAGAPRDAFLLVANYF